MIYSILSSGLVDLTSDDFYGTGVKQQQYLYTLYSEYVPHDSNESCKCLQPALIAKVQYLGFTLWDSPLCRYCRIPSVLH